MCGRLAETLTQELHSAVSVVPEIVVKREMEALSVQNPNLLYGEDLLRFKKDLGAQYLLTLSCRKSSDDGVRIDLGVRSADGLRASDIFSAAGTETQLQQSILQNGRSLDERMAILSSH
jgi:hypothetical protein